MDVVRAGEGKVPPPWHVLSSLNDCFRPMHMEGWKEVADCRDFAQALGELAQQDTKHNIGYVTVESRMKRDAWDHLLSLVQRKR